ncbi:virion core protein, T7 gp14 family [Nitrincola sp. A-D6]|uniref:virion core protein, T7 gp14 family n=1 Tax=Nitrincola sp. A-D6 TaxID=1545442 RepID=UPI00068D8EF1|nr:hypothetical protein [Nitrincola sp. A-D6]
MCEPIAIASFALSAGSSLMAGQAQDEQAAAQSRANYNSAVTNNAMLVADYQQQGIRQQQEGQAAISEQAENSLEALRNKASMATSAGESGVGGASVNALLADLTRQNANRNQTVEQNLTNVRQQVAYENKTNHSSAKARNSSMPKPQRNNWAATGLQIAGAGISSYGQYKDRKAAKEQ